MSIAETPSEASWAEYLGRSVATRRGGHVFLSFVWPLVLVCLNFIARNGLVSGSLAQVVDGRE